MVGQVSCRTIRKDRQDAGPTSKRPITGIARLARNDTLYPVTQARQLRFGLMADLSPLPGILSPKYRFHRRFNN